MAAAARISNGCWWTSRLGRQEETDFADCETVGSAETSSVAPDKIFVPLEFSMPRTVGGVFDDSVASPTILSSPGWILGLLHG